MNIHQVCVSYVNEQDRFLLRINTRGGKELRLWFTRRLTLGLLPLLRKTFADQMKHQTGVVNPAAPLEEQRQRMLENFQKEAAAYSGDYTTPYQPQAPALPRSTEPLLITDIKMTLLASGQLQMQMFEKLPGQSRNLQVVMDPPLTQGLLHLLGQGLKQSQWLELPPQSAGLDTPPNADTPAPPDGADKPRYLN